METRKKEPTEAESKIRDLLYEKLHEVAKEQQTEIEQYLGETTGDSNKSGALARLQLIASEGRHVLAFDELFKLADEINKRAYFNPSNQHENFIFSIILDSIKRSATELLDNQSKEANYLIALYYKMSTHFTEQKIVRNFTIDSQEYAPPIQKYNDVDFSLFSNFTLKQENNNSSWYGFFAGSGENKDSLLGKIARLSLPQPRSNIVEQIITDLSAIKPKSPKLEELVKLFHDIKGTGIPSQYYSPYVLNAVANYVYYNHDSREEKPSIKAIEKVIDKAGVIHLKEHNQDMEKLAKALGHAKIQGGP